LIMPDQRHEIGCKKGVVAILDLIVGQRVLDLRLEIRPVEFI
jgi:hypothetical protein